MLYRITHEVQCAGAERTRLMPNVLMRWMLFLSSYFPLTVIIFILFRTQNPALAWIALGAGSLGLVVLVLFFFIIAPKIEPVYGKVTSRQARGGDVMGYIASYIIPFVTFPLNGWQQISALLLFLFILGIVYVNSEDMIRINPTLNIVGFRLYEITLDQGKDSYALITRRRIKHDEVLKLINIGEGVYLEKKA